MERNSKVRMSRTDRKKKKGKNKIRFIWESLKRLSSWISTVSLGIFLILILLLALARLVAFASPYVLVLFQITNSYRNIIIDLLII
ncbi:hypothetical protein [Priestia megaterium]|uniref:hypothetical protein n=1 Tax=Priestia megaterium TaxID=1404 RepID=UPI0023DAE440|nr:hypothetical protein [Priestia megaterium]MDF2052618.1 hypothetical protein [Priestia megaterium]MDF2058740.1 hypothetical protein [Priestia megaterium]